MGVLHVCDYTLYTCKYLQLYNSDWLPLACFRPLMYLLPKPSLPPNPQHGCLLSSVIDGLCWGCNPTHGVNLFMDSSRWKGIGENNHNILRSSYTERQKDTRCFSGRKISVSQSLGHQKGLKEQTSSLEALERDSWHSPASSQWQIFLQTAVLWQCHYGTFQTLPSGFKGTCCTWICVGVYLFLYCTFKHEYLSVYCKTERGDRQRRAYRLRSTITH